MTTSELKQAGELKKEIVELKKRERIYKQMGESEELKAIQEKILALLRRAMREELKILEFIEGVEDSHLRRIISLRFLDNLSWTAVAIKIGGGNTSDSVRRAVDRYLKTHSR